MKYLMLVVLFVIVGCTESAQRKWKNVSSEYLGGLERTCVIYSMSGAEIKRYSGTFDLKASERQLLFDLDGKRHIIRNATVICDEK